MNQLTLTAVGMAEVARFIRYNQVPCSALKCAQPPTEYTISVDDAKKPTIEGRCDEHKDQEPKP